MKKNINLFLENFLSELTNLLPKIVLSIFIVIIGYLIGRLVEKIVKRFILYLDQSFNVQLQKRLLNVDLKSSATFISKAFFWIILIISILICIQVLELDFLNYWFDRIIGFLPNVLVAIIIVFVGIISGRLLGDLIKSAASRTGMTNGKYLGKVVRYLILFVAIVVAVDQLGVDIGFLTNLFTIILASLLFGASLAFGLGAKTSISNILGSYYARKTYTLGNIVKINNMEGTIVKITDTSITIETKTGFVNIPAKDFNETTVIIIKDT